MPHAELRVCTISKYPPYMSGHSFESMNQNRALFEFSGQKHHELTYAAEVYDPRSNFNDSPELMAACEGVANVHRVGFPEGRNVKVHDGALIKAMAGVAINLVENEGVNVLSTYYLDPHALIANQASAYARDVLGRRVVTAHKAVGSDVLNSIANHYGDGQARFLLAQFLAGDIQLAVSEYTKHELVRHARVLLPECQADRLDRDTTVLYAPFDNEYFEALDIEGITSLRSRLGINPETRVISYFGRVFPEKGIDDLIKAFITVKEHFPDITLVIGGQGIELEKLKQMASEQGTSDIIFTGGVSDRDKRALMQTSELGVIPTKPIANFVETLCISALEYLASGTPLVTTPVGGVSEAAGSHSLYCETNNPESIVLAVEALLSGCANRAEMITQGQSHVRKFNYLEITRQFLALIDKKMRDGGNATHTTLPTYQASPVA